MLRGTYTMDDNGMDELHASTEMANFIKALQIPHSTKTGETTPEMSDDINSENCVEMMNGTRESTASSPSRIHYGHYKAACESEVLTAVNLMFMALPFKAGIPLQRWTCSLHCMIQKVRKPYVTKLRIVQLYEADFNTMLKYLLGRRLMGHSEDHVTDLMDTNYMILGKKNQHMMHL